MSNEWNHILIWKEIGDEVTSPIDTISSLEAVTCHVSKSVLNQVENCDNSKMNQLELLRKIFSSSELNITSNWLVHRDMEVLSTLVKNCIQIADDDHTQEDLSYLFPLMWLGKNHELSLNEIITELHYWDFTVLQEFLLEKTKFFTQVIEHKDSVDHEFFSNLHKEFTHMFEIINNLLIPYSKSDRLIDNYLWMVSFCRKLFWYLIHISSKDNSLDKNNRIQLLSQLFHLDNRHSTQISEKNSSIEDIRASTDELLQLIEKSHKALSGMNAWKEVNVDIPKAELWINKGALLTKLNLDYWENDIKETLTAVTTVIENYNLENWTDYKYLNSAIYWIANHINNSDSDNTPPSYIFTLTQLYKAINNKVPQLTLEPESYQILLMALNINNTWEKLISQFLKENATSVTATLLSRFSNDNKELQKLATIDPLTKLSNRRAFNEEIIKASETANRKNKNIGVIFVDIDFFKKVNDTFWHEWWDDALRDAWAIIHNTLRPTDWAFRYWWEELVLIIEDWDVLKVAERLRQKFEDTEFSFAGTKGSLTISVWVWYMHPIRWEHDIEIHNSKDKISTPSEAKELKANNAMWRSDSAVYKAKELWRNQVILCELDENTWEQKFFQINEKWEKILVENKSNNS